MPNSKDKGDVNSSPSNPQTDSVHRTSPSHTEVMLWTYLPAVLVDIAVTTAVFLLAEAMLRLASSYLTSIPVLLRPILTFAGRSFTLSSAIAAFLPIWLLGSVIAIIVRYTLDTLRIEQSKRISR